MSGKIEFITRKGKSLDPKYPYYEYWAWRVTGENNDVIELTPKYSMLMTEFKKMFAHEKKMDIERNRKPDATKWAEFIIGIMNEAKQNNLLDNFLKKNEKIN